MRAIWDDNSYSLTNYVEPAPSDNALREVEQELGVELPVAYVNLASEHNGGLLALTCHAAPSRTSWADDHVSVHAIMAIGHAHPTSLCGDAGSAFWPLEWGYPDIGVYFADCPSAGHDMIALDYRTGGEPQVVHVDQERDFAITVLAPSFATFIDGLQPESAFPLD